MKKFVLLVFILSSVSLFSQGFKKVKEGQSNINFVNKIIETEELNGLTYSYLYNGGGVAVGDVNNDGLEDLYFTGNQTEDKLYLNKGDLEFKDVTDKYFKNCKSGTFHTGVTMVDINNDGWLDIYVSVAGPSYVGAERANLLYINKKGKGFSEQAQAYGLADTLNTTQTVFFDYDLDGDLDCYMLNHIKININLQANFPTIQENNQVIGDDHFYENDNGIFIEKSKELGLISTRYGLGIAVSDLNNDGYPDIYVTNDFNYPDKMFLNQKGTFFIDSVKEKTGHVSVNAMGIDIADFNNDGLFDIMSVDMAGEDHVRSKKNMGSMSTKDFWNVINNGVHYQYMFNTLQLNLGNGYFSEVAQMAGVSKSDWSWAPLIVDFDNDGFQDIFISNGIHRDVRDNDFKNIYDKDILYGKKKTTFEEVSKLIPSSKLVNYIYKNNGDLTFTKMNFEWGMVEPVNVNGASYADLDNDGDIDLIMNVIDDVSFIMENVTIINNNFLDVKLTGMPSNVNCVGAEIEITLGSKKQFREVQTVKGFQSSVTSKVHFGLGNDNQIDSLIVKWGNGKASLLVNVDVNELLIIDYENITKFQDIRKKSEKFFSKVNINELSDYVHEEFLVNDFKDEVLLPHKMSQLGPFVTVEDINNDGFDDVFIGGARAYASKMYFQNSAGDFELQKQLEIEKDKNFEDMQAVFFDFDNDGDKDLYVVSGGNESPIKHASLGDRLYINSNGIFEKSSNVIPDIRVSGQKVLAKDIDHDGWVDLVVFGRQIPKAYPSTPKTSILMNRNGVFIDEVKNVASELEFVGMVTDAIFTDFDNDGDEDLIVVGEWMSVTVFENNNNYYSNVTKKLNLDETVGWWSAIKEVEINGHKKYLLGNIGKNNKYHPSQAKPLQVYLDDFDDNGTNDIILAKKQGDICYPVRGRQCSSEQMSFIVDKFPTYTDYATANLASIYSEDKLNNSIHFNATMFESAILTYSAGGFSLDELPNELQIGCVNTILEGDFNNDDNVDYLFLGNKYEAEVETIRYDANYGGVLTTSDNGELNVVPNYKSGLYLNSNVKDASFIKIGKVTYLIVVSNSEKINIFKSY
jgi:hypothetical protein